MFYSSLNKFHFRYRDSDEDIDTVDQEAKHFEKLKQKIEERKKTFAKTKQLELDSSTINEKELVETVVENHDDVQDDDPEPITEEVEVQNKKKTEKVSHEFKVLGNNDFERKAKVSQ